MSQAQTSSRAPVRLAAPVAGTTAQVLSGAGARLEFGFDPQRASFERSGTDLTVRVDGGGTLVLQKFFEVGDNPLPDFVLADGGQIASADLLKSLDPNFDLSTAAGPSASSSSSGSGEYDDGAGSLLGGLDRLGSLGADQWGNGTPFTELEIVVPETAALADAPSFGAPEDLPPAPPVPPAPVPPVPPTPPAPVPPTPPTPVDPEPPAPPVPPVDENTPPDATPVSANVVEDAAPISGNLADAVSDPDAGDSKSFTYGEVTYTDAEGNERTVTVEEAGLTLNGDGTWSLDPSSPLYDALGKDDTGSLKVGFTVTDGSGAKDSDVLTITVEGVDPVIPSYGVKVALTGLGIEGHENPKVVMPLLDADGNPYAGPDYPASVSIPGLDASNYNLAYDPETGLITITMKVPGAAAPTESLTVIPEGGEPYVVSLASSADDALEKVDWNYPEGVTTIWGTWAGTAGHHINGSDFPADISGDDNNVNTPLYDAEGVPLHLQFTDSSFTARNDVDGAKDLDINVAFGSGGGSLTLSNEGHVSDIIIHHDNPWRDSSGKLYSEYSSEDDYFPDSKARYDASLSATVIAKGTDAVNTITVTGGETLITTGEGQPATGDADHARVSAVYAMDGGTVDITADRLTVGAQADGFAEGEGKLTVVSGVRADGVVIGSEYGDWKKGDQSTVRIAGTDVTLGVTITGDADTQDHTWNTYAAVAATEQGQVDVAAEDSLNVSVENRATGDTLATDGAYGIFSGYDLGRGDLPSPNQGYYGGKDFYQQYLYTKHGDAYYSPDDPNAPRSNTQSEVNLSSGADVNVSVNLGSGNYSGEASGIKTVYGDVSVKAGKDINVSTTLGGEHRGGEWLSAVSAGTGLVNLEAEGDVNLSLASNGGNNAVIHMTGAAGAAYSMYKHASSVHLAGENIRVAGTVGAGGAADNHSMGIAFHDRNSYKKSVFTVESEGLFSVSATALNNGGSTSATGISAVNERGIAGTNDYKWFRYNHQNRMWANLGEEGMTVSAEIRNGTADVLPADATAIGINVVDTTFSLLGYAGGENGPRNYTISNEAPLSETRTSIGGPLTVSASGGRYNTGIQAGVKDVALHQSKVSAVIAADTITVNATGGAVTDGDSHSYGVNATVRGADSGGYHGMGIAIQTGDFTVNVEDSSDAVGLRADGLGATVEIRGRVGVSYDANWNSTRHDEALKVVINCKVTGPENLHGIALEALNGGHVLISANNGSIAYGSVNTGYMATKDAQVELNGDVVLGVSDVNAVSSSSSSSASRITLQGGQGNDRFTLNGDAYVGDGDKLLAPENYGGAAAYKGTFLVETGAGNDQFTVNGGVHVGWKSTFRVDAGDGSDNVSILGVITYEDGGRYLNAAGGGAVFNMGEGDDQLHLGGGITLATMDMGGGNDILSFEGAVTTHNYSGEIRANGGSGHDVLVLEAPDLETFNAWYQDWLTEQVGSNPNALSGNMQFESVIVTGIDNPADPSFQWFQTLMEQDTQIDFQVYTGSLNLHMLSDLSNVSAFQMDGSGANDMLYVRYDGNSDHLADLGNVLGSGQIAGVEELVLDMSDGQAQTVDLNAFVSVMDSFKSADSQLFLRVGADDTLNDQGWDKSATAVVHGIEYQVYSNPDTDDMIYVQQVLAQTTA